MDELLISHTVLPRRSVPRTGLVSISVDGVDLRSTVFRPRVVKLAFQGALGGEAPVVSSPSNRDPDDSSELVFRGGPLVPIGSGARMPVEDDRGDRESLLLDEKARRPRTPARVVRALTTGAKVAVLIALPMLVRFLLLVGMGVGKKELPNAMWDFPPPPALEGTGPFPLMLKFHKVPPLRAPWTALSLSL